MQPTSRKYFFLLILYFAFQFSAFSQVHYRLIATIPDTSGVFTTDNQGNIYIVHKDELVKYNSTGHQLYKYSNKNLGNINSVDASNMLKILVYYRNFSQVVFLDNTLSVSGEPVSLDKLGFQQVMLACTSHNNGMWIYDQSAFSLLQLTPSFEVAHRTDNLPALLNMDISPSALFEHDNKVYLCDPAAGILIFDIYGTYYKTVPAKNVVQFVPVNNTVYYLSGGKVRAYNLQTTEVSDFDLPQSDLVGFSLQVDKLYLQSPQGISIYAGE